MPTHEALTTYVDAAAVAKGDVRSLDVERYPYIMATANESQSLTADSGSTEIKHLIYNGWLFARDDTDTTTAHDGVTCLVSSDGIRFLKEDVGLPKSVLDITNTPPGSPTAGDAYIIDTSPTGAWASNAKYVTVYTARGWVYIAPAIGMLMRVEDVTGYYHYSEGGSWTAGIDNGSGLVDDSVYPNALLYPTGIPPVENQTTNTPPAIPAAGTAYIIGSSPTGDWAAKADYLVVSDGSAWNYHAPSEGMIVYDKAQNDYYKYDSAAWVVFVVSGLVVWEWTKEESRDGGLYSLSSGTSGTGGADWATPPTNNRGDSIASFSHSLSNNSNKLFVWVEIIYRDLAPAGIALFVDSETEPRAYAFGTGQMSFMVEVSIGDTSSHDYKVRHWGDTATAQRYQTQTMVQELS